VVLAAEVASKSPEICDPKAWAAVEDNFRKTIGQLLVGAVVLVGAGLGATVAYRQLMGQQPASRDPLISNQVSKGFEQLGDKDGVVVRLDGFYALVVRTRRMVP
jgi:hypothetical protein